MKIRIKCREQPSYKAWRPGDKLICTETHNGGFEESMEVVYKKGKIYTLDKRGVERYDYGGPYNEINLFFEEDRSGFSNYVDKFKFFEKGRNTGKDTKAKPIRN